MVDSGAFTIVNKHGGYPDPPALYATLLERLHRGGVLGIDVAVAQDWMCEPMVRIKTGLSVEAHQRLTVARYDELRPLLAWAPFPLMPVLQGWATADYLTHLAMYGDRLEPGAWVGVGSVCKRAKVTEIEEILTAIVLARPDLRLHGFGVKLLALRSPVVRALLYSADSMAWSFSARRQGRNANDWREARQFEEAICRLQPNSKPSANS